MKIDTLSLEQAQDAVSTKTRELQTALKEAKSDGDLYDPKKAKQLGDHVKNGSDLRDEVKKRHAEINAIQEHIEGLSEIKAIEQSLENEQKRLRSAPGLPSLSGDPCAGGPSNQGQFKSLGTQAVESDEFKAWLEGSRSKSCDFEFKQALATDLLAASSTPDTMQAKAAMLTSAGFAPESIRLPGFVEAAIRPVQLIDIIPTARTSQAAVPYMIESAPDFGAAETAEAALFGEATFGFTEATTPVRKITSIIPVSDEQLEDVPLVEGYINNRIPFGLRQHLDAQSIVGPGTGLTLRGILNTPNIQTRARGTDTVMDAFYRAQDAIMTNAFLVPTHHIMHPLDFQAIQLAKTDDGVYLYGDPVRGGPDRLWGLPIVKNQSIAAGRGLVGSFMPNCIELVERRGIDIQVGYTSGQFERGMRSIRGDMRAAMPIYRPDGFHEITGLNAA